MSITFGQLSFSVLNASTRYAGFVGSSVQSDEELAKAPVAHALTVTRLVVRTIAAQSATGALTITLRKNGVDTGIQITIAANAAAGMHSTTGSVAFAAGDHISVQFVNAGDTSTSIRGMGIVYTDTNSVLCLQVGATVSASATRFVAPGTSGSTTATESNAQTPMPEATRITTMCVRTHGTQSATGNLVITVRKAGVDTALAITIAAGAVAGTTIATGAIDFAADDLLSIGVVNAATAVSTGFTITLAGEAT
jgi:hypothetical protein